MQNDDFDGNKKVAASILWNAEQRLIHALTPRVPRFLNGYNLTLVSLAWIALVLASSWLAREQIAWLHASSAALALHWLTDSLDGAVGRYRNSGLVRWGFYTDHLLDFIFSSSIVIGYAFLVTGQNTLLWMLIGLVGVASIGVSSFLSFSVMHSLKITNFGIGPTEYRIIIILLNTIIIYAGVARFEAFFPYVVVFILAYAAATLFRRQRQMYALDKEERN